MSFTSVMEELDLKGRQSQINQISPLQGFSKHVQLDVNRCYILKRVLTVSKFGKPWERTKRNRCLTTELLRACNRLIGTVSLQERSE